MVACGTEDIVKYLILVGDGMADFPIPELGGKTPLEAAFTPSMDDVASAGLSGLFCPIPEGFAPGSDIGNLSLFGYSPRQTFSGRAPLEAASQGITLGPGQLAFRCNLVTLQNGVMQDFTSGHISTDEARSIISALATALSNFPVRFSPGVSYRHLTIVTPPADILDDLEHFRCVPPHDITGQPFAPHLPSGPGAQLLLDLMQASIPILAEHPVNQARVAAGKLPATSIWLWGQGRAPSMATYQHRFGLKGSVISAVDLVKGLGICAGLDVINVPGATGYLDTNYNGKVAAALEALRRKDFVFLHVEAPDEASHEGSLKLKIRAIEDFDAHVVGPCLQRVLEIGNCRVLVAPDHITALSTKTHAAGPVPFAMCGTGIEPDTASHYCERAAESTGVHIAEGSMLTEHFLTASKISTTSLNQLGK